MTDESSATTRVEREVEGAAQPGFAGMPGGESGSRRVSAGAALPAGLLRPEMLQGERDFVTFQLPAKVVGFAWRQSGFSEAHLSFALVELSPDEENRAVEAAGQGMKIQQSFNEMVKASLYQIGGGKVPYDKKGTWLTAIGPRARKIVDKCFNELNGIEESAGESVLATATPGRG